MDMYFWCWDEPPHSLCPSRQVCSSAQPLLTFLSMSTTNFPSPGYSFRRLDFHFFNDETSINYSYSSLWLSFSISALCHSYTPVVLFCFQTNFIMYILESRVDLDWSHRHKEVYSDQMFLFHFNSKLSCSPASLTSALTVHMFHQDLIDEWGL